MINVDRMNKYLLSLLILHNYIRDIVYTYVVPTDVRCVRAFDLQAFENIYLLFVYQVGLVKVRVYYRILQH